MATLDFVLASALGGAGNTSSVSVRGVAIRVPDALDPYSQQELRDLLSADFQRGAQAVIEQARLRMQGDAVSLEADFSNLQTSLQQAADRWLAARAATPSTALPLLQGEALLIHARQQLQQFESWLKQTRRLIAGQTEDKLPASDRDELRSLANQLRGKLASLAALLDGILDAPTDPGLAENARESVVQAILAAIEEGHSVRSQLDQHVA